MSILSLGQIMVTQRNLNKLGESVRSAVEQISQTADNSVAGGLDSDAALVSPQSIKARINTYREASQELARSISEVAFAAEGAGDIQEQLAALEAELGAAADKPLDEKSLQKVNRFIESARVNIDAIAERTQVALPAVQEQKKSTENTQQQALKLNSKTLLGNASSVSNLADVRQMMAVVQNAAGKMANLREELKANIESFDVMASHIEVSMENQIAATSYLPQEDLSVFDMLLNQSAAAASAQGNRLQPGIMNLI